MTQLNMRYAQELQQFDQGYNSYIEILQFIVFLP